MGIDLRRLPDDDGECEHVWKRGSRDAAVLGKAGQKRERIHRVHVGRRSELGAAGEPDDHDGAECLRRFGSSEREHVEFLHRESR